MSYIHTLSSPAASHPLFSIPILILILTCTMHNTSHFWEDDWSSKSARKKAMRDELKL
jgi:hypothetical protein